jgi:hypothetical protein
MVGAKSGPLIAAAPLVEKQAVAFVFFERRGVEDAEDVIVDTYGFDLVGALAGGAPV